MRDLHEALHEALHEGFSYCKCEILWLLSCIAKISAKNKKGNL